MRHIEQRDEPLYEVADEYRVDEPGHITHRKVLKEVSGAWLCEEYHDEGPHFLMVIDGHVRRVCMPCMVDLIKNTMG